MPYHGGVRWVACAFLVSLAAHAASLPQTVEFNRDIRPILSDKCFTCHGPDPANRKTKLRFDNEEGAKIELARNRYTIVPGNPSKSELYQRIATDDQARRMPPAYAGHEKLNDGEIDLIRRWIEQGAVWQRHWSLLPPRKPAIPSVRNAGWTRNPIDYFVLERLEREGLQPAAEADKPTLIRRASLDLTGLPPTPGEVESFLRDSSPDAYEKVLIRLLASPRYAERMAYRWMEAARYADTNGYQSDGNRDMWRWRDWVIDAFARNMPFDQFTIEQIAGDLLPNATLGQKIATGFHRNHRTSAEGGIVPEEFRVEYVADRVDTTATVWLGLTMGCARCHDHKYDPITQKEYYRMFAYFNRVPEKGFVYNFGNDEPLIKAPTEEQQKRLAELDEKVAETARRQQALQTKIEKARRAWEKLLRGAAPIDWTIEDGQVFHSALDGAPEEACDLPLTEGRVGKARSFDGKQFIDAGVNVARFDYQDPFTFAAWIKPESDRGAILSKADDYFEGQGHGLYLIDGKVRLHIIYRWTDLGLRLETVNPVKLREWQHVLVTYDGKRKASGVQIYIDGRPQELKVMFDQLVWPLNTKLPFRIGAGGGLRFQGLIDDVRVYNRALTQQEAAVIPLLEPVNRIAAIPQKKRSEAQENKLEFCFLDRFAPRQVHAVLQELRERKKARDDYYATIPTVMVMEDSAAPRDTFLLKRGAYDNPGEKVAPGVPASLPPLRSDWPDNRLGLARWLVDRSNPLTARVTVNRFWQMFFGTGLVKTVEDFGSQGEWPIHPQLLDWLATEFMDSGWNIKALQKTILMSATYRQSSRATPELLQKDQENRLLARGARFRLPAEMIRDQALFVSRLLVEKTGGPPVKPYQPPGLWQELTGGKGYEPDKGADLYRRSLYTYWRRTIAPASMVLFDSPNRETCYVKEVRTNTPLQALILMNDMTYLEAARKLAERMLREGGTSPSQRIEYACKLALARAPKPAEAPALARALDHYTARYRDDPKAAIEALRQGESARDQTLEPAELAAYAAVAGIILNLDEVITRE
jgi:hypothetical protein